MAEVAALRMSAILAVYVLPLPDLFGETAGVLALLEACQITHSYYSPLNYMLGQSKYGGKFSLSMSMFMKALFVLLPVLT